MQIDLTNEEVVFIKNALSTVLEDYVSSLQESETDETFEYFLSRIRLCRNLKFKFAIDVKEIK